MKEDTNYNKWHKEKVDIDDMSTVWYDFAKSVVLKCDLENKNLLEIGCGRGGFSNFLASLGEGGAKVFACDFSESALQIAKRKYNGSSSNITWQREDIQKMSFGDNSFDIVVSCETIEHVPKPKEAIKELFRVLKPGGKVILTCPNYFNLFGIWCLYRWLIKKPFDEGGQPYVNYILLPQVYVWVKRIGFNVKYFHTSQVIIPNKVPKNFFMKKTPSWLNLMSYRTFYVLVKPLAK